MAENNSVEYKNISDLPTLESVDQTAWAPVEIAGKEGKKVDLDGFTAKQISGFDTTDSMTDAQKAAFLGSAYIPVKGTSAVKNVAVGDVVKAQVQSDWNQSDSSKPDFVKNKPTIPDVPAVDGVTIVDDTGTLSVNTENIIDSNCGLSQYNNKIKVKTGTGGLYLDNGEIEIHCSYPLENDCYTDTVLLHYDTDTLTLNGDGLTVVNPVPSIDDATDCDVLSYVDGVVEWHALPTGPEADDSTIVDNDGTWSVDASALVYNNGGLEVAGNSLKVIPSEGIVVDGDGIGLNYDGWSIICSGGSTFDKAEIYGFHGAEIGSVPIKNSYNGMDWVPMPSVPNVPTVNWGSNPVAGSTKEFKLVATVDGSGKTTWSWVEVV